MKEVNPWVHQCPVKVVKVCFAYVVKPFTGELSIGEGLFGPLVLPIYSITEYRKPASGLVLCISFVGLSECIIMSNDRH